MSAEDIVNRIEQLNEAFPLFVSSYNRYAARLTDPVTADEAFVGFGNIRKYHLRAKGRLQLRLKELRDPGTTQSETGEEQLEASMSSATGSESGDEPEPSVSHVTPPKRCYKSSEKPDIGEFSGKPVDWSEFRDLYIAEVHNSNLDNVRKFQALKRACGDRTGALLTGWHSTGANYEEYIAAVKGQRSGCDQLGRPDNPFNHQPITNCGFGPMGGFSVRERRTDPRPYDGVSVWTRGITNLR
jgi:hypothetical protein